MTQRRQEAAARQQTNTTPGLAPGNAVAQLRVLFVCTGNRFRSPLAAALFERAVSGQSVDVRSAGTLDTRSAPPFPETITEALRLGLDLSHHRSRPITHEDLTAADLVVGFERSHLAVSVVEGGAARERAFTLPELVELVELDHEPPGEADPSLRIPGVLERAHARRVALERHPGQPELADPVGGPAAAYARTADEIDGLVTRLARALFAQAR